MPRVDHNGHERYDTTRVFAGYQVKKIKQGGGRDQWEVEVPAKSGDFYPVAEAAVGLLTKTAHTVKILTREFPEVRVFTTGEDGRCVLHFPVTLWPKIARRCGAFKSRAGLPRSDKQLAATQAATAKLAEVRTKAEPSRQMALEL
jgi:hypothetical protein